MLNLINFGFGLVSPRPPVIRVHRVTSDSITLRWTNQEVREHVKKLAFLAGASTKNGGGSTPLPLNQKMLKISEEKKIQKYFVNFCVQNFFQHIFLKYIGSIFPLEPTFFFL